MQPDSPSILLEKTIFFFRKIDMFKGVPVLLAG